MWTILLGLAGKLLEIFFPGQSKEKVARDDGATSGIAQQKAADQGAVIKDVQDAKTAANSVDVAAARGVPVTNTDGFRRD
jgi:hypothetical protein